MRFVLLLLACSVALAGSATAQTAPDLTGGTGTIYVGGEVPRPLDDAIGVEAAGRFGYQARKRRAPERILLRAVDVIPDHRLARTPAPL